MRAAPVARASQEPRSTDPSADRRAGEGQTVPLSGGDGLHHAHGRREQRSVGGCYPHLAAARRTAHAHDAEAGWHGNDERAAVDLRQFLAEEPRVVLRLSP